MGILTRMMTEAPEVPRDPTDDRWWGAGPAYPTMSGQRVTTDLAMSIATVFACVRVIAEDEAGLPLKLYRRRSFDGREGKEVARDHRLYSLFHSQPNPWQDAMEWREMQDMHVTLQGNAYSRIVYNGAGHVEMLRAYRPEQVTVEVMDDGDVRYRVREGSRESVLLRDEMFHLRGLSSDGYVGLSVIGYARESLGLSAAIQEHGARFYRQGTRFSGVYEHPKELSETAFKRLQAQLTEANAGLGNFHRAPLLEDGLTYKQNSMSARDAQFIEMHAAHGKEICRWFRMQPHKVGIMDDATFSNIEQQAIEHVTDTILPWAVRWQQAANRTFGLEEDGLFLEHTLDGLLRGDVQSRYNAYAQGRNWGWFSVNDIRELENLNPIPNGDIYLQPSNMTEAGAPQPVAPPSATAQARLIAIESATRLVRKEIVAATRNAERFAADNEAWRAWVNEFYGEHWKAIMGSLHVPAAVAKGYCERQKAELLEGGLKAVEAWDHERPIELASLALGEAVDESVFVPA